MPKIDEVGNRHGRLTVLEEGERGKSRHAMWLCKCDCGNIRVVDGINLRSGHTKSCGCLAKERASETKSSHGLSSHRLYKTHKNIVHRCTNPKANRYDRYGGRGITVCDEWLNKDSGLKSFIEWAEENGHVDGLQIDRIDNDGNYEPSNCRCVTPHVNSSNRGLQPNNKSGYSGVCFDNGSRRWMAYLGLNGKFKGIGRHDTKQKAVEARNNYIIENNLTEYSIQEWRLVENGED